MGQMSRQRRHPGQVAGGGAVSRPLALCWKVSEAGAKQPLSSSGPFQIQPLREAHRTLLGLTLRCCVHLLCLRSTPGFLPRSSAANPAHPRQGVAPGLLRPGVAEPQQQAPPTVPVRSQPLRMGFFSEPALPPRPERQHEHFTSFSALRVEPER